MKSYERQYGVLFHLQLDTEGRFASRERCKDERLDCFPRRHSDTFDTEEILPVRCKGSQHDCFMLPCVLQGMSLLLI